MEKERDVIGNLVSERICRLIAESVVENLFDGMSYDLSTFNRKAQEKLSSMGIEAVSKVTDYERILLEYFKLNKEQFELFPSVEAEMIFDADLLFDELLQKDGRFKEVKREVFDLGGMKTKPSQKIKNNRLVWARYKIFLNFCDEPHVMSFRLYDHWDIECTGPQSSQLMLDFKEYVNSYMINKYRGKVINLDLEEIKVKTYKIDDLVFPVKIKKEVDELITSFHNWYEGDKVMRWGYIFIGSPGTGKTTMGGVLMEERPSDCTVLYVPASDIRGRNDIDKIFDYARLFSPCLIQIDDVDLISKHRDEEGNASMTSALMENLDGLRDNAKIFIVQSTNAPEKIDRAVIDRAGRVSSKVVFTGFAECLPDLVKKYSQIYGLRLEDDVIDAVIGDLPDKMKDLTPDESKNIVERLYLLNRNKSIGCEQLLRVIEDVYKAFHDQNYEPGKFLGKNSHQKSEVVKIKRVV